jgi:hypothetical protein
MDTSASNVGRIAALVRSIVEEVSFSIWHPNGLFPAGWCDDCSRVLGALLKEAGENGFELVVGSRGEHLEKSHIWLRRGDLIVDITADQFPEEGTAPVMVTTTHVWHDGWMQYCVEPGEIDSNRVQGKLYDAIKNTEAWRLKHAARPRKTIGKRTKRLLGDLDQTSVNPELKQMLDSRSDASNHLAEAEKNTAIWRKR